jgi:hypothetical protein
MVKKRKIDWMFMVLLKEWKGIGTVLGTLNLKEISQTFSSLVTQLFIDLGGELGIW